MPLRTYPLIAHPAFLAFVEHQKGRDHGLHGLKPDATPTHRPEIRSITDIADYLQISHFFLRSILRNPSKHYRQFHFKKKNGGVREINSPRTFLKVVQWWILDTILYNSEIAPEAHGFVPYKSFVTNAREHVGASHLLNVDIKDFFPSIRSELVSGVFSSLGYGEKIALSLARLTTLNNQLPQGAPTSPTIANLVLKDFDKLLSIFALKNEFRYTRYADDITISGSKYIPAEVLDFIRGELAVLGLELNEKKTRFMGPNSAKEVTGLLLGAKDVRLPREVLNAARGWFHHALCDSGSFKNETERLRGTLSLIKHIGGAGSASVVKLGAAALLAVENSA